MLPHIPDCIIDVEDTRDRFGTMPRDVKVGRRHGKRAPQQLSVLQERIIEALFTSPIRATPVQPLTRGYTAKELAALLGVRAETLRPRLAELESLCAVAHYGNFAWVGKRKERIWEPCL